MLVDLKGTSTVTCADAVNYPSWYIYPPSYGTRSLTHVPAYEVGNSTFGTIDISDTISSYYKYWGGVLAPNGKIYLVPRNADNIGELEVGNHQPSYEVAGGVPLAWAALLSPHFNKF